METNTLKDLKPVFEIVKLGEDLKKVENDGKFPSEVFPLSIQEIIQSTSECLGFPIDFIGSSILYAASVAIGNLFRVEVKKGWTERATLYMVLVARPGTNKSHPLNWAIKPIEELDKRTFREYELKKKEFEDNLKRPKELRNEDLESPYWIKHLLSDFTPEGLAQIHNFNRRGLGVHSDELSGWIKRFNQYHPGSEMEFWLSTWSGTPIKIDRKSSDPLYISLPFISVGGTIHRKCLNEMTKNSGINNGFIDRFLFVMPDGLEKPYWSETEVPEHITKKWNKILHEILSLQVVYDDTLNPSPDTYKFSPEAKNILFDWQRKNTDQCNECESDELAGMFSKMDVYIVRIALVLEVLQYACDWNNNNVIGVRATEGAVKLIEYFKGMAIKVNNIISSSPFDRLPTDKQKLYDVLPPKFSRGQGWEIAEGSGMIERTFTRFLSDQDLFTKLKHGEYEKRLS
jgi:hypothetical protein